MEKRLTKSRRRGKLILLSFLPRGGSLISDVEVHLPSFSIVRPLSLDSIDCTSVDVMKQVGVIGRIYPSTDATFARMLRLEQIVI